LYNAIFLIFSKLAFKYGVGNCNYNQKAADPPDPKFDPALIYRGPCFWW